VKEVKVVREREKGVSILETFDFGFKRMEGF